MAQRHSYTVLINRGSHIISCGFHLFAGIAHRHANAGITKHGYVIPAVKVSVGYEWGEYTGKVNAQAENRTQSNTVRASLQVLF